MNHTKHILIAILLASLLCGSATAWLTGYDHRIPITVNNGGASELTHYQFNFTNDTNVLVAAGQMQASGMDCRITDASDNLIPFWNETAFNAAGTKIWANATTLAVGDNTFYMYYGNSGAADYSDGNSTFELFDNFDDILLSSGSYGDVWTGQGPCDAWGMAYVNPLDSNEMIYFYRSGPNHYINPDAKICRAKYNISANTWSGIGDIVWETTDPYIGDRQMCAGVIGDVVYIFLTRYYIDGVEANFNKTSLVIANTTDNGDTWTIIDTINTSSAWGGVAGHDQVWGHLIQSDDGRWLQPWYCYNNTSDSSFFSLIESADNGLTWTFGSVFGVSDCYGGSAEPDIVNIGGGRLLMLYRNTSGAPLTQVTSSDNGITWGTPQITNVYDISEYYQHASSMIYDAARDKICLTYICFNTDKTWYLEVDPDDVFDNPTSYPSPTYVGSGGSYVNNPITTKIGDSTYYILWSAGYHSTVMKGGVKTSIDSSRNWRLMTGSTPTVSEGVLTVDNGWIYSFDAFGQNYALKTKAKMSSTDIAQEWGFSNGTVADAESGIWAGSIHAVAAYWYSLGYSIRSSVPPDSPYFNSGAFDTNWHTYDIIRNGDTDIIFTSDGTQVNYSPITDNISSVMGYIHLVDYLNTAGNAQYDWLFVRQCTATPPTATIGIAESDGGSGGGAYNITLLTGWNIIGWTPTAATTAHSMGGLIGGNCTYIIERNAMTGEYVNHNMAGPEGEDNFAILRGWGYFVDISAETFWERAS